MSSIARMLEGVRSFFADLHNQYQRGKLPFEDVIDNVPDAILEVMCGTPAQIGRTLERHDTITGMSSEKIALRVRALADAVQNMDFDDVVHDTDGTFASFEYHLLILYGYVYSAVVSETPSEWVGMVAAQTPWVIPIAASTLDRGRELMNGALRWGCNPVWERSSWERGTSIQSLIRRLEEVAGLR